MSVQEAQKYHIFRKPSIGVRERLGDFDSFPYHRGLIEQLRRITHTKEAQEAGVVKTIGPLKIGPEEYLELSPKINFTLESIKFVHIYGSELSELIKKKQVEFWKLFEGVFKTVNYFHSQGWVLRDIKPSNIIYDIEENAFKLIDYETARPVGIKGTDFGRTNRYAPPEVYAQTPQDLQLTTATDEFCLGVSIAELLGIIAEPENELFHNVLSNNQRIKVEKEEKLVVDGVLHPELHGMLLRHYPQYLSVLNEAIKPDPSERISASQIWHLLIDTKNCK